jgi:hypothetical protein
MTGLLYGCVNLQTYRGGKASASALVFPFNDLKNAERGNHLSAYDADNEKIYDYVLGGVDIDRAKLSATSRGVTIAGVQVSATASPTEGVPDTGSSSSSSVKQTIYKLLAVNSDITEDEKSLPYLDLVWAKVSSTLSGKFLATFDVNSDRSKLVIISRDVPVYMFLAFDDCGTYLVWSNEISLRQRMRDHYGDSFYYYPLGNMVNGTLVLQAYYLNQNWRKWRKNLRERIKVFNAFEEYINKKIRLDDSL